MLMSIILILKIFNKKVLILHSNNYNIKNINI